MGLPHNDPVTSAKKVKLAPIGALLIKTTSASFIRQTMTTTPQKAITMYINNDIQAEGT
jgi:hypothetical protein